MEEKSAGFRIKDSSNIRIINSKTSGYDIGLDTDNVHNLETINSKFYGKFRQKIWKKILVGVVIGTLVLIIQKIFF